MHGSKAFVADYAVALSAALKSAAASKRAASKAAAIAQMVDAVLIPPIAYIGEVLALLVDPHWSVGAQNLHPESSGAFTGEISGAMIRDLGALWVLTGHSERREYAAETAQEVARKTAAALRVGLKPIVCVGETLAQREAGQAEQMVRQQLAPVFEMVGAAGMRSGAVAYEPVWAIGTGETATPEIAQAMHEVIRRELGNLGEGVAQSVPVLYGGSVKAANAAELFAQGDIDGALVGGASLDAQEFVAIVAAAMDAAASAA